MMPLRCRDCGAHWRACQGLHLSLTKQQRGLLALSKAEYILASVAAHNEFLTDLARHLRPIFHHGTRALLDAILEWRLHREFPPCYTDRNGKLDVETIYYLAEREILDQWEQHSHTPVLSSEPFIIWE